MRRWLLAALGPLAAMTLMTAPAKGEPVSIATPELRMTISVPDVVFDGPGAVKVAVTCTYTKLGPNPRSISGSLRLNANQAGASNGITGFGWITLDSPAEWSGVGVTLTVWPNSVRASRGPLLVTGTLTSSYVTGPSNVMQVPPITVNLVYDTSTLTAPRAKYVKGTFSYWSITGMATAQTITQGVLPAGGTLTLFVRKPKSKVWVASARTSADNYGEYEFRLRPATQFPKGTRYRVQLSDCGWCTDAVSSVGRL